MFDHVMCLLRSKKGNCHPVLIYWPDLGSIHMISWVKTSSVPYRFLWLLSCFRGCENCGLLWCIPSLCDPPTRGHTDEHQCPGLTYSSSFASVSSEVIQKCLCSAPCANKECFHSGLKSALIASEMPSVWWSKQDSFSWASSGAQHSSKVSILCLYEDLKCSIKSLYIDSLHCGSKHIDMLGKLSSTCFDLLHTTNYTLRNHDVIKQIKSRKTIFRERVFHYWSGYYVKNCIHLFAFPKN